MYLWDRMVLGYRTMKKYGIDVDGVLADFAHGFSDILRELGLELSPDYLPNNWSWTNCGLTDSLMKEAWKLVDSKPDFWNVL